MKTFAEFMKLKEAEDPTVPPKVKNAINKATVQALRTEDPKTTLGALKNPVDPLAAKDLMRDTLNKIPSGLTPAPTTKNIGQQLGIIPKGSNAKF